MRLLPLALSLGLALSAHAGLGLLLLGEAPGENEILTKATVNDTLTDIQVSTYSGTIELAVAVEAGEVTGFQMTGGTVNVTDTSYLFEVPMLFSQTLNFEELEASPVSPNGMEALAIPGKFSAPEHYFFFTEGCAILTGDLSNSKTLVQDEPFNAAGTGSGCVTLSNPTDVVSSLNGKVIGTRYLANILVSLDSIRTETSGVVTVTTETTGDVTAQGDVVDYLHPFYEWAAANAPLAGDALAFDMDADADGRLDGLSWALGFAEGDPRKILPMAFDVSNRTVIFVLPGETRNEIRIQGSPNLMTGTWSEITADPIPEGVFGSVSVTLPPEETLFLRLVTSLE